MQFRIQRTTTGATFIYNVYHICTHACTSHTFLHPSPSTKKIRRNCISSVHKIFLFHTFGFTPCGGVRVWRPFVGVCGCVCVCSWVSCVCVCEVVRRRRLPPSAPPTFLACAQSLEHRVRAHPPLFSSLDT